MSDNSNTQSPDFVRKVVSDEINRRINVFRDRAKHFVFGFCAFVTILIGMGVLAGAGFFQTLHNKAFPSQSPNYLAISYKGFLDLTRGDNSSASRSISFYATKGQNVSMYARLNHRFVTHDNEKRKVVVSMDGNLITKKPTSSIEGGFHDITPYLNHKANLSQQPNVHELVFSLDDSQPRNLISEVSVVIVVLVRGVES